MFAKRKISKQKDIFAGIASNEEEANFSIKKENEPVIEKKVKTDLKDKPVMPMIEETKFKANFVLQNQNNSAVEKIMPEQRPITNDIVETLQRLKSIHSIDDIKKGQVLPQKKSTSLSTPISMPSNVKFSCTFDFNPMLCKDYHDTGYCTFGDSCIYIHDRGDYKSGWEQEKEYQEQQKRRKMGKQEQEDLELKEKLEEFQVPENCGRCEQILNRPVQTQCGHYFCEKCIIQEKKCPCGKLTNGIFRAADKIIKELKDKRDKFISEYKPSEIKITKQRFSEGDWMY